MATIAGGYLALVAYHQDRELSVGEIRLSVDPGHKGALDLYAPLVDWGARFEAIKLPVRLRVDLRTVDRRTVARLATGEQVDVTKVRTEARDAIAGYLRGLIVLVFLCASGLGLLTAFAVRNRAGPRLRFTAGTAVATALAGAAAIALLIPPRGQIDSPQYYAFGPDIPRALQALEAAGRSSEALDQELDSQLVGLARLVIRPGERAPLADRPSFTVASDLHNNVLAVPVLERVANKGPVFFVGDLTDRGSPLELKLTERIVNSGRPFVFVSGNHDSDVSVQRLARRGAIVLTERGRLHRDGTHGDVIQNIAGVRVAGYSDPYQRRSLEEFADRFQPDPTPQQQAEFTSWLRPLVNKVDVVMVHEPALIQGALEGLKQQPPAHPIVFLVGHTHQSQLTRQKNVTVLNDGSIGAGGTGNLAEDTKLSLGRLIYDTRGGFEPLAADLVDIDPGTGSSTARRERLGDAAPTEGAALLNPGRTPRPGSG